MSTPLADGVLAATHRLVQQALSEQWHEVPKTLAERRALLDALSAGASPQDRQRLAALQQAMAESDAVVASLAPDHPREPIVPAQDSAGEVDTLMSMIRAGRS